MNLPEVYGTLKNQMPGSEKPFPNRELFDVVVTQSAFTCSKLTIETLEQGVEYVPS